MKKDSTLGDRMKKYEKVNRTYLLPRTYTIIRIDGKAFHTFTKGLDKPWDDRLSEAMMITMGTLFTKIQGVKYAYTQSDEISLVLTDFDTFETQSWFDRNIQKIISVSASIATAVFNKEWMFQEFKTGNLNVGNYHNVKMAEFDSRVFQLPNREEVINYFIWRQQDAVRNSISSLAQSLYSHKELHGKNQMAMKELCFKKGSNWNDVPIKYKRGIGYYKWVDNIGEGLVRHVSQPDLEVPTFSEHREYLKNFIPDYD